MQPAEKYESLQYPGEDKPSPHGGGCEVASPRPLITVTMHPGKGNARREVGGYRPPNGYSAIVVVLCSLSLSGVPGNSACACCPANALGRWAAWTLEGTPDKESVRGKGLRPVKSSRSFPKDHGGETGSKQDRPLICIARGDGFLAWRVADDDRTSPPVPESTFSSVAVSGSAWRNDASRGMECDDGGSIGWRGV